LAKRVRVAPDMRMAVVGSPSYFDQRNPPKVPQDLTAHSCINLRLPAHGGLYAWEFEKTRREMNVRVDGHSSSGGRPGCLPRARAAAMPSRVRSTIRWRSKWAMAPNT